MEMRILLPKEAAAVVRRKSRGYVLYVQGGPRENRGGYCTLFGILLDFVVIPPLFLPIVWLDMYDFPHE